MTVREGADFIDLLVSTGLAGTVATTVGNTLRKSAGLLAGDPACTFGLSDCGNATMADIERAVRLTAGADIGARSGSGGIDQRGYIDPHATVAGMERYAAGLARHLRGGSTVLLATGHPGGLLAHYVELAFALSRSGCAAVRPHDGGPGITAATDRTPTRTVRFVGSVACVYGGFSLAHSHLSVYMETMLDDLQGAGQAVDLVVADHGMAGAAIERGIQTLAIADVNDVALSLAYMNGLCDSVMVVDDNLLPEFFRPITTWILQRADQLT